jgi:hypothetical protein
LAILEFQESQMSDAESLAAAPVAAPRPGRALTLVLFLMVLALAVGAGILARDASAMQRELQTVRRQLDQERDVATSKATAIDNAFSPLVVSHVKTAHALLKKGVKAAAKAELSQAQKAALALRSLGSGDPPGELIASLTGVEKAFGQPPTLLPATLGGT